MVNFAADFFIKSCIGGFGEHREAKGTVVRNSLRVSPWLLVLSRFLLGTPVRAALESVVSDVLVSVEVNACFGITPPEMIFRSMANW